MAQTKFNKFQYNIEQFNNSDAQEISSTIGVYFAVVEFLASTVTVDFGIPLERDISVDYGVYQPVYSPHLRADFQVNSSPDYVSRVFTVDYSVGVLVSSSLTVSFGIQYVSELEILFDVGDIVYSTIRTLFSVPTFVESDELTLDFSVDSAIELASDLPADFSVVGYIPLPLVITTPVIQRPIGYRIPYGYEQELETWPPTLLEETDSYTVVTTNVAETADVTYTVGAVCFATQFDIINNQCATVNADRMLNTVPSELRQLAWDAEYDHQVDFPSKLELMTMDGDIGIVLSRLPADIGKLKDIEVWTSGVGPSGALLKGHQKALYLRYGDPPNMTVESYVGTIDEIAALVLLGSQMVDLYSPSTTLHSSITPFTGVIRLSDATDFPNSGYIVIDEEVIYYTTKSGNLLENCMRGVFDTVAVEHDAPTDVQSTSSFGRTAPVPHPLFQDVNYSQNKLSNVREIALVNDSNSGHFALWKTLAAECCVLWSKFYEKINSFFTRFAKLKYLKTLAENMQTNLWYWLQWIKLVGHTTTPIEAQFTIINGESVANPGGTPPFFIGISGDFTQLSDPSRGLYNLLNKYHLVGLAPTNKPFLFKIDNEYFYASWVGSKLNSELVSNAVSDDILADDNVYYLINVIERAVEYGRTWTVGVAHNAMSNIEYIPTDLKSYSGDGLLLSSVSREPSHLFKERLRLYRGTKANFPSFREIYDVLEDIVPGSTIDFWDYYSTIEGTRPDPFGPILDKEVGWLLGVPGRTEFNANTYLGLNTFTQGYWEWLWNEEESQVLQVKGSYPFFVRTRNWWFDPELLYEVTERFKSAGTTPNYAINKEVFGWNTYLFTDESPYDSAPDDDGHYEGIVYPDLYKLEAFKDNLVDNPLMEDGVVVEVGAPLSGDIINWSLISAGGVDDLSSMLTMMPMPTIYNAPLNETVAAFGARIEQSYTANAFFRQPVSFEVGTYFLQCYIKNIDNLFYDGATNSLKVYDIAGNPILGYCLGGAFSATYVEDIGNDWYVLRTPIDIAVAGTYDVGLIIPFNTTYNPILAVSNVWVKAQDSYTLTDPIVIGQQYGLLISGDPLPSNNGWLYIRDGGNSEFLKYETASRWKDLWGTWSTKIYSLVGPTQNHAAATPIYFVGSGPNKVTQSLSVQYAVQRKRIQSNLGLTYNVA